MIKLVTTAVGLCALVLAIAVQVDSLQAAPRAERATAAQQVRAAELLADVRQYRTETWRWQRLMGVRPSPSRQTAAVSPDLEYRIWVRDLWRRRAAIARRKALHPPHRRQWQCIHSYEGRWQANSGNGYYGGLQMDISFQRHYGAWLLRRKGTADKWSPLEQMWVAERAHRSGRGFFPWPRTARYCGLI